VGSLQRQLDDDCVSDGEEPMQLAMHVREGRRENFDRPASSDAPRYVTPIDSSVKVPSSVKHFTHPGTSWFSAIWYALRTIASFAASLAPCGPFLSDIGWWT